MYKKMTIFNLFVILSGLLVLSACKLATIENPQVKVTQSRFHSVSLTQGRLDNQLSITNPNVFKLPIENISYTLYLNDKKFVSGTTQHSLKIPAGASRSIDLPLTIRYEKLVTGLGSLFRDKTIQFQLSGEIDFGLIKVPYQKSGEFSVN
ncbi:MAG: LEA type 2 family protein [Thioalkalispiraceae bacterium]|jgi:LEA14-like dessication related protein